MDILCFTFLPFLKAHYRLKVLYENIENFGFTVSDDLCRCEWKQSCFEVSQNLNGETVVNCGKLRTFKCRKTYWSFIPRLECDLKVVENREQNIFNKKRGSNNKTAFMFIFCLSC